MIIENYNCPDELFDAAEYKIKCINTQLAVNDSNNYYNKLGGNNHQLLMFSACRHVLVYGNVNDNLKYDSEFLNGDCVMFWGYDWLMSSKIFDIRNRMTEIAIELDGTVQSNFAHMALLASDNVNLIDCINKYNVFNYCAVDGHGTLYDALITCAKFSILLDNKNVLDADYKKFFDYLNTIQSGYALFCVRKQIGIIRLVQNNVDYNIHFINHLEKIKNYLVGE